eukprot:TRINITY_DN2721_c0_g1_i2.p1 TRINITY_DN2721_c0_g1~~TRINITY_DN2721_c0_g1_i2.p1  ORF type:complete len:404 (-),score=68.43 TRINITY_DN2721_c0_g1_i2:429-1529(-)
MPNPAAGRQSSCALATVPLQVLSTEPRKAEGCKRTEEDAETTDVGSSDSEADTSSSASCSAAGSDSDRSEQIQLSRQLSRRSRPAPARQVRLPGFAGRIFRGTPLPTIPGTPAAKVGSWGAEDPSSSEEEEEEEEANGAADERATGGFQVSMQTPFLTSPPPAPDRPAPVPGAQQLSAPPTWDASRDEVHAPPGLPALSRLVFRPPPGLPAPLGLQLAVPQCSRSGAPAMSQGEPRDDLSRLTVAPSAPPRCPPPSTAPPAHHAPTMLPLQSPTKSKMPPRHPVPLSAPPQHPAPCVAPPSHPAPAMTTSKLHGAPPAWNASSPPGSKSVDHPDFFLPGAQADIPQAKLSTEGTKTCMTGLAPRAR